MKLIHAIPALPASDMERSAAFYRDKLGFTRFQTTARRLCVRHARQ